MKIAMFTDAYKPQVNGMVTSIETFTKCMRFGDNKVFVFAPRVPEYKKSEKFVYRFRSIPLTTYREYRIGVPYRILTDRRIKNIKFDIVHVHSPFSMGGLGLGYARHYGLPTVGTFHTLFTEYMHYFLKYEKLQSIKEIDFIFKRVLWKYLTWFYNQCDVVVAPSNYIKRLLLRKGIDKEIYVIPTGILPKKKPVRDKKRFGLGKKDKIILHVGRITKEKNMKFMIDSLKDVLKDDTKLLIASDGPYKKDIKKVVEDVGVEDNVIFTGYMSLERLNSLYASSDVLVTASKSETQCMVLAEAASNGLPMVILDAPVVSDFVKKYKVGFVSAGRDFSKNVEKILNSKPLRDRMIKNCDRVLRDYSAETCSKNMLKVYEETLRRKQ